ncbi:hypothetical protein M3B51_09060 [Kocuria carniphila]|uniref:hypothetical protein n=1 Tax=Kocuria carniphila TaxID=262208 RepID=UPI0021A78A20|nr:hypothetical protein [Kocuria carniphila]MCT1802932.1 hypothetical protein [Kocuria carniphila]
MNVDPLPIAPGAEDFRALARSSPWRFTTLHFTHRHQWVGGSAPAGEAVEAWLDRNVGRGREDGPDQASDLRSAVVLRLIRNDECTTTASPAEVFQTYAETPSVETKVKVVAAEGHHVDKVDIPEKKPGTAYRRERSLENLLSQKLARQGVKAARLEITNRGQSKPLMTDTWDKEHQELYKAKDTVARAKVREAIGQLLDYRRHITPPQRPVPCCCLPTQERISPTSSTAADPTSAIKRALKSSFVNPPHKRWDARHPRL